MLPRETLAPVSLHPAVVSTRPILRLENLEQFNQLPLKLRMRILDQLGMREWEWNPALFDIRIISHDEQYLPHYLDRIHAINEGVHFLLEHDTTKFRYRRELKTYIDQITAHCQDMLRNLSAENQTKIDCFQNALKNYLDAVVAILSSELGLLPDDITKRLGRAEQFVLAGIQRPAICTITSIPDPEMPDAMAQVAMIDKPEDPFDEAIREDFRKILRCVNDNDPTLPFWFSCLNEFEKHYLRKFLQPLNLEKDLGTAINAISSKLRIIPVPANYATHTLITCIDGEIIAHTSEKRFSHIASRDVVSSSLSAELKIQARRMHAVRNLRKIIKDCVEEKIFALNKSGKFDRNTIFNIPILFQTLISPVRSPDSELHEDKQAAISLIQEELHRARGLYKSNYGIDVTFSIIPTNHPLNYARIVEPTTLSCPTGISVDLLSRWRPLDAKDEPKLKQACEKLVNNSSYSITELTNDYRELHLSSMEQAVVELIGGISIGGCVSGKDRKAIEIAHTDALHFFYDKFRRFPPLTPSNPQEEYDARTFASIFAAIYCSKHQHVLSALNAPGSFGTKTPGMYMTKSLRKAVKAWYAQRERTAGYAGISTRLMLKESNIMASNNELRAIKIYSLDPAVSARMWEAPQMDYSAVYHLDNIDHIAIKVVEAIAGINEYLATIAGKLTFFEKMNLDQRLRKAECLESLLNDGDFNYLKKLLILSALMQAENVGEHIQSDISAAMGFCSRESARKAIVSAIRHVVEARMNTQLPEEIAEIKESVNRIIASTQAIIFSIGDKTDDDIKKELMVQFRQLPLGLCDVVDRVNVMFCGINRQP